MHQNLLEAGQMQTLGPSMMLNHTLENFVIFYKYAATQNDTDMHWT